MDKVLKNSSGSNMPVHTKVANYIRQQIYNGDLTAGDCVSSEKQLCQKFGVSRGPIRQAMDILVKERLVYRSPGKGTFVSEFSKNRESYMAEKDTLNIAVFMDSDFHSQWTGFFADVISSLNIASESVCPKCNLAYQFHEQSLSAMRDLLLSDDYDGYVFVPLGKSYCRFIEEEFPDTEKPVVSFFRPVNSNRISQFYVDQEEGAFRATDYLIRGGHSKIAFLLVSPVSLRIDSHSRMVGYKRAFEKNGLAFPENMVIETSLTPGSIKQGVDRAIRQNASALLIGGQALISPTVRFIDQNGLSIPDDMSIISFDDDSDAVLHDPPLTVISQPLRRGARLLLDRLVAEIGGVYSEAVSIPLFPELIVRDSCKVLK